MADESLAEKAEKIRKVQSEIAIKLNDLMKDYSTPEVFMGIAQYVGTLVAVTPNEGFDKFLQLFVKSVTMEYIIAQAKIDEIQEAGSSQRYPN